MHTSARGSGFAGSETRANDMSGVSSSSTYSNRRIADERGVFMLHAGVCSGMCAFIVCAVLHGVLPQSRPHLSHVHLLHRDVRPVNTCRDLQPI